MNDTYIVKKTYIPLVNAEERWFNRGNSSDEKMICKNHPFSENRGALGKVSGTKGRQQKLLASMTAALFNWKGIPPFVKTIASPFYA